MGAASYLQRSALMKVPFLNLRAQNERFREAFIGALSGVMLSPLLIHGDEHRYFEERWANYCRMNHCVGVGNGYDALRIMLEAYGIERRQVIVASNTHISTWLAVEAAGGEIVPVDPNEETFVLDKEAVANAAVRETAVVLATNLYGNYVRVNDIRSLNNIEAVFLDAAQAHGLRSISNADAAAFSFYPTKNLGALGDGGAIVTNDARIAYAARFIRNYGALEQNKHMVLGCNSRLDELQAAFLSIKLQALDEMNARRKAIADRYTKTLASVNPAMLQVPRGTLTVYHQYVVLHKERDLFRRRLEDRGIGTLIHYPTPPHLQPAFAHLGFKKGNFPVAERLSREILSLPVGPELTDEQVDYVIECIEWCA